MDVPGKGGTEMDMAQQCELPHAGFQPDWALQVSQFYTTALFIHLSWEVCLYIIFTKGMYTILWYRVSLPTQSYNFMLRM